MHKYNYLIFFIAIFFFTLFPESAFPGQEDFTQEAVQGCVDSLKIDGDRAIIQGWAGTSVPGGMVVSLSIFLDNILIHEGDFKRIDRRDVAKQMERSDWRKSGWRVDVILPKEHKSGKFSVTVKAKLETGDIGTLQNSAQITGIVVDQDKQFSVEKASVVKVRMLQFLAAKNLKIKILLIALSITLCAFFLKADFFAAWLTGKTGYLVRPPIFFSCMLVLLFLALLSLGVTGSSLRLGTKATPFVQSDEINIWGQDLPVRSDEWLVSTPYNIAQYNHRPQFPILNRNIGEDGQNMLITCGAPVAHISTIAKPITWGFFLFDLKRALSWYWLFPIFSCLFALWSVIALTTSADWRFSFLFSLWFCMSPYSAAWSNGPLVTVFFPSLALLAAIAILKSKDKYLLVALGCILGIAIAGFVLILYPPWQVSLTYVYLALTIGIVFRDQLYKNFSKMRLASYAVAIIVAGFVLWCWWSDAHEAIQAMSATVYPGERTTIAGGNIDLQGLLRGFTNLVTMHKMEGTHSNKSEIASFCYLLLPLALLFVFRLCHGQVCAVGVTVAAVMIFILCFMLVGVPVEIVRFSLWGRVPPERADIALGLSYTLLCGMLLSNRLSTIAHKDSIKALSFGVTLLWAIVVLFALSHMDNGVLEGFSPGVIAGLFFFFVATGYWLALGKTKEFVSSNLLLSVATIIGFNPINIAPKSITVLPSIDQIVTSEDANNTKKRILVLESYTPAMYLLASGIPVANGVFFLPQRTMWEKLDENHLESNKYNRYQHLVFTGGTIGNNLSYRIESPSLDMVRVVVDLERFDFAKVGADLVAAPMRIQAELQKNSTLSYVKSENGWTWFKISGS